MSKIMLLAAAGKKLYQVNTKHSPYIAFHLYEERLHRCLWFWWYRDHLVGTMTQDEFIKEKKSNSLLQGENSDHFYYWIITWWIQAHSNN